MADFIQPITEMLGEAERPAPAPSDPRAGNLYLDENRQLTAREALRLMVRSWPFISAHRRLIAEKCVLAFLSLVFFLVTPWPLKIVIDNVIDGHPLTGLPRRILFPIVGDNRMLTLWVVCGFLAIAAVLIGMVGDRASRLGTHVDSGGLDQAGFTDNEANVGWSLWNGLFGLLEAWVTLDLTQRINQSLRTAVYEGFLRSPLRLFSDQKIGDAVFRVMHDSAAIGAVLYRGVIAPAMSIVMFLMVLLVLGLHFSNVPIIPILAAAAFPIILIVSALFGRPLREQAQRMRERGSDVMAAFEERVAQVQLIKAFGQERRETQAIETASWSSFHATLRIIGIAAVLVAILVPLVGFLVVTGLYHLMLMVIEKRLTLGDVVLLGSYGMMLGDPIGDLASTWAALQPAIAGLRRIHSVLDRLAEGSDSAAAAVEGRITAVDFDDVSVGYDPAAPVLSHVSMALRRGELVALAGASGSGKSTLLSAIPRFIDPLAGRVLINHRDARELDPAGLRARIGFVFQQEALFSATIDYNIRYGTRDATDAAVRRAAQQAGAAEFIASLPLGYHTMLGRRGARLSVGQKQRIAIARALLRDADLIILDEPAAPLEPASETALLRALKAIARDRIVLLVAHRQSTLAQCDRVYFADVGTVVTAGSHEQLVRASAAYRAYLALGAAEIHA